MKKYNLQPINMYGFHKAPQQTALHYVYFFSKPLLVRRSLLAEVVSPRLNLHCKIKGRMQPIVGKRLHETEESFAQQISVMHKISHHFHVISKPGLHEITHSFEIDIFYFHKIAAE